MRLKMQSEDSKADYLQELEYEKQNSFLEDLDAAEY